MAPVDSEQYDIFCEVLAFIQQTSSCARHSARQGGGSGWRSRGEITHTAPGETASCSVHPRCRKQGKQDDVVKSRGPGVTLPLSEADPAPIRAVERIQRDDPHNAFAPSHMLSKCQFSSLSSSQIFSLSFQAGGRTHRRHIHIKEFGRHQGGTESPLKALSRGGMGCNYDGNSKQSLWWQHEEQIGNGPD